MTHEDLKWIITYLTVKEPFIFCLNFWNTCWILQISHMHYMKSYCLAYGEGVGKLDYNLFIRKKMGAFFSMDSLLWPSDWSLSECLWLTLDMFSALHCIWTAQMTTPTFYTLIFVAISVTFDVLLVNWLYCVKMRWISILLHLMRLVLSR